MNLEAYTAGIGAEHENAADSRRRRCEYDRLRAARRPTDLEVQIFTALPSEFAAGFDMSIRRTSSDAS